MRCALIFLLVATFLVAESSAFSSSTACSMVNGQWICNQNNGNGNSASSASSSGNGGSSMACTMVNGQWNCQSGQNGAVSTSGGGNTMICNMVNGEWSCQSSQNNGAAAMETGGEYVEEDEDDENDEEYEGSLPVNNEQMTYNNVPQPIYNQQLPNNNVPMPFNNGFNNGGMVSTGAWAGAGAFPNFNGGGLSMDEILRNPFKMLNIPQRQYPQRQK